MKKTLKTKALLVCACALISTMLQSCDYVYQKRTDRMIAQCEKSLDRKDYKKSLSKIIDIQTTRKLTQEQSNTVQQLEDKIRNEPRKQELDIQNREEEKNSAHIEMHRRITKNSEEERIAVQKREEEKIIKFDYTLQQNKPYVIDHISTIRACDHGTVVEAKIITVPKNKVWVFKRFYYSGYRFVPELHYYGIAPSTGYCLVHDAQVFYPGQYVCYIYDYSSHLLGHRTATIKFSEEAY